MPSYFYCHSTLSENQKLNLQTTTENACSLQREYTNLRFVSFFGPRGMYRVQGVNKARRIPTTSCPLTAYQCIHHVLNLLMLQCIYKWRLVVLYHLNPFRSLLTLLLLYLYLPYLS